MLSNNKDPQLSVVDLKEEELSRQEVQTEWLNKDRSKDNIQIEVDIKPSQDSKLGQSSMNKESRDNIIPLASHHM